MNQKVFEEPVASELERKRDLARARKGKLTYDCYHLKVLRCGDRVACDTGKKLTPGTKGTLPLQTILNGRTCSVCYGCARYNGD